MYLNKIDFNINYHITNIIMYSKEVVDRYIGSLTDIQKKAYEIAKEHLGSSFDITKSIGFLKWIEKNKL